MFVLMEHSNTVIAASSLDDEELSHEGKQLQLALPFDHMETSKIINVVSSLDDEVLSRKWEELHLSLPKVEYGGQFMYQYQGRCYPPYAIQPMISFKRHFQAQDTDIVVASKPKTGTTWLKSLVFAVINRTLYKNVSQNHPLLTSNPHELIPFFELQVYSKNSPPDLTKMATPRLFSTHLSYMVLPESIKDSDCRIVYICRNPFDAFVSDFHFNSSISGIAGNIEEFFNTVCKGVEPYAPFVEHVLEYWKESLERPEKVLFLKYEDLKEDIVFELKRLAMFLGVPFSLEEEKEGVIEDISKLCSFENLRDLEVNKTGKNTSASVHVEYKHLFRKGEVGDWVNYLTPSMVERFEKLMHEKLGNSGLTFKYLQKNEC